jgi:hypothetical protein
MNSRRQETAELMSLRTQVTAVLALVLIVLVTAMSPAGAQNKCDSGKLKCMRKKALCILKAHEKAIKKGETPDATRLADCQARFDNPADGCVAKLEAKQNPDKPATVCGVVGNTATLEGAVDTCVTDALVGIGNPVGPNKCDSKKLMCMRKKAVCLLKAQEKALKKGEAPDAARLSACAAKFDDLANGCIAKVEAKQNPDEPESVCTTSGNTAALESIVDTCVADALGTMRPTPTATLGGGPTLTPSLTPGGGSTPSPTPTTPPCADPTDPQYPTCGGSCPNAGTCLPDDSRGSCVCTSSECDLVTLGPGLGVCVGTCDISGGSCVCSSGGVCLGNAGAPCLSNANCSPGYFCVSSAIGPICYGGACTSGGSCPSGGSCFCDPDAGTCMCQ